MPELLSRLRAAGVARAHARTDARAAARGLGAGALASRPRRARGGARRRDRAGRRRGGADRLPAGADALAVLRHHPGRAGGGGGRARGPRDGPTIVVRATLGGADRGPRPRLAVRARRRTRRSGRPRLQHRDRGRAGRIAGLPHAQAPHPGHRRLLRGPLLPARTGGRRAVPAHPSPDGRRRSPARLSHLLGPVVPRAGPRLFAGGRRGAHLPDGDRLRARPPGVRHRAPVAAGDRRQRDRQRDIHGRDQPNRRGGADHLLRLELHLRSLRPGARPGPP